MLFPHLVEFIEIFESQVLALQMLLVPLVDDAVAQKERFFRLQAPTRVGNNFDAFICKGLFSLFYAVSCAIDQEKRRQNTVPVDVLRRDVLLRDDRRNVARQDVLAWHDFVEVRGAAALSAEGRELPSLIVLA